jgi:hypothetical protein
MSGSKTRYLKFCRETYVPLHLQAWWLDAVCGPNAWDAAVASDRQGFAAGVLPYFRTRRWGLPVVQQPPYTAYAGPWFQAAPEQGIAAFKQLDRQHRTMQELIGLLPAVVYFKQCFHPEIQNWLPFYWAGFRQTTRYSYVLPAADTIAQVYAGLKNTLRTDLRRAGERTEIVETDNAELLFRLNAQSYARKGLRQPYYFELFQGLHHVLSERRQAIGYVARDRKSGSPHAGLYLVFDARQAAVLLTGLNPLHKGSGALNSLYWQAIQFCATRKLDLDFEGSMQPGIERVFRNFGGQLKPYFQVWRIGKW